MKNSTHTTPLIMTCTIEELKSICLDRLQYYDDKQQDCQGNDEQQSFYVEAYDTMESLLFKLRTSDPVFWKNLRNKIRMEIKHYQKQELAWKWEIEDSHLIQC